MWTVTLSKHDSTVELLCRRNRVMISFCEISKVGKEGYCSSGPEAAGDSCSPSMLKTSKHPPDPTLFIAFVSAVGDRCAILYNLHWLFIHRPERHILIFHCVSEHLCKWIMCVLLCVWTLWETSEMEENAKHSWGGRIQLPSLSPRNQWTRQWDSDLDSKNQVN